MKILHVTDLGLPGRKHGITEVVLNLSKAQHDLGHEVNVFNVREKSCVEPGGIIRVVPDMSSFKENIATVLPDIVIFHSLYNLNFVRFSRVVRQLNIPYLVMLHGSTSQVAQDQRKYKKWLANLLLVNNFVKHSHGLIYLNQKELDDAVVFTKMASPVIIPNGCTLPKVDVSEFSVHEPLRFIFLARIDINQKGLDLLVEAIKKIYPKIKGKAVFDFYGYTYDDSFQQLIAPYGDMLRYHEPVYDAAKDNAFRNADIFVLTSRFEGMPMSVLEALSYGLPCLITPQTNMTEFVGEKAGWIVDCNPDAIAKGLEEIVNTPSSQLVQKCADARLAVSAYSWEEVANTSINVYHQVIG